MVIPKYGLVDGKVFVEGGGVRYEDTASGGKVTVDPKKYRGGGGGSSYSQTAQQRASAEKAIKQAERNRIAELARQAELKRQQEEARKLREQIKAEREQKASSQTIGGQVSSNGPKVFTTPEVQAGSPEDRYTTTPYRQSFLQSTKQAVGGLFADIGAGSLGSPGKYIDKFKYSEGLKRDVLLPDEITFTPKKIDVLVSKIKRGDTSRTDLNKKSIITIDPIFTRKKSEKTYGDIQREIETKREKDLLKTTGVFETRASGITGSYQGKVSSGELTVEQATKKAGEEFDVLNVEYAKEQEKSYKKYKDVPGVFERTGTTRKVVGIVPDVLATGASIAVGVVNPVAGASIGLAYFGGKGLLQATQKPTYKEVGQQGGLYAGVTADEKGRLSVTEPTELDIKYKGLRTKAGINLLIGAAYGGGLGGAYEKSYYTQALKDVGESPIAVKSISYAKDKSSFDIIKGVQKSGQIERQITISGKVIKQGDKTFIMPSGQGYSTTAGKFLWGSKGIDPVSYAGGDVFKIGSKGASFQLGKGYATFGKGVIEPQLSFGSIFKSSTKDIGKTIASKVKVGGKADVGLFTGYSEKLGVDKAGAEYYKSIGGKVNVLGTEGSGFRAFSFKAPEKVGTFGVQKVVKVGVSSVDDISSLGGESLFSFGRGTGTKIVKGYGSPATQTSLLEQSSKAIGAGQIKTLPGSPGLKVGGASLSSKIIKQQKNNGFTSMSLIKEEIKPAQNILTGQSVNIIQKSKQRGGLVSKQSQGLVSLQLPALNVAQLTGQIQRQKLKQKTIQESVLQQSLIQPVPSSPVFGSGSGFGFGLPLGFVKPQIAQFGKSRRVVQKRPQRTAFQTSFTGSILGVKGKGLLPGGLSIRGILPEEKSNKKKKFWL